MINIASEKNIKKRVKNLSKYDDEHLTSIDSMEFLDKKK